MTRIDDRVAHNRLRDVVLAEELVCWICGLPGTADDPLTLDHIVSRSRGGQHERSNGRAAHRSCNSAKGSGKPRRLGIRVIG